MSNLSILKTSIRQYDNLYSLNDLHKASGSQDKHLPFRFMRNEQTQDLICEIQKEVSTPDLVFKITRGRGIQGTYACKELVIAYAAWISPAFHLVVLRAFLNQVEQKPQQLALPEPKPEQKIHLELTESEFNAFGVIFHKYIPMVQTYGKQAEAQYRAIFQTLGIDPYRGNKMAGTGYDIAHEFNSWINTAQKALERHLN